ncbi:MAG: MBL fold metallo-hydrolase [Nitrososphaeraceae archaeon]|nr:MBL fold metallo-hydrolase [Nitrososphaeraceae archaeon]
MTDLTGIFSCDDGGTYWVRQVENKVYWFGRNGPPTFSNIFIGTIYIGVSENGIIYNADLFGINFTTIEAIILSHGHMDHCRGLVNVLSKCTNPHTLLFILMLF